MAGYIKATGMEEERKTAADWFRSLRDEIVTAFEAAEHGDLAGPTADLPPARFEVTPTPRHGENGEDLGGGIMSVMRGGRVFEKVGVNFSAVEGTLGEGAIRSMAQRGVPGIEADPRFWAAGISLVAHMQNPHVPAVHMNTRMFWTPSAWWFGGGADLNPPIPYAEDTAHFHATQESFIAPHGEGLYPQLKAWADEYFFIPHRGRARGVGGTFMDDRNTGDWAADFALTRDIGRAFLPSYLPLIERRRNTPWTESDRDTQLIYRGLYAEYNLVWDRGTKFGLATGHNADAVLMSLPPLAKWT
ncbi:oxygen-dependent coproporphyrinogen oxidase [Ketogulonicigenium vulgare]|uniref:oxygen-dependent coproporphyrinogen oxidase n=1 Tax=Ketogulonicigenium vulgare TaxID=92945 RepID=UPI0023581AA2|nr:oxygen-dependent coproporphyrinogen oxidase [Ketogulonicigenium vulgare]